MFNLENKLKPILKWAGGKRVLLPQLIEQFPLKFSRYIEPFFGGGAVFLALDSGCPGVINDKNNEIIHLYKMVRDQPYDLMSAIDEHKARWSREYFYELRSTIPDDAVARASRTLFLNKTCHGGLYRVNADGGFNTPFDGTNKKCPGIYKRENFIAVAERLKQAEIHNSDFAEIIDNAQGGDFVYCDPPYKSTFTKYTAGGFTTNDQRRLLDACAKAAQRGAMVAVSNSATSFILKLYDDWNIKTVFARRLVNRNGAGRNEIREMLALSPMNGGLRGGPSCNKK